ncbi:MAG: segregation/condensation protein A [Candidatus Hydrogenedentota bacterium]
MIEKKDWKIPEGIKLPDGTRWEGHHVLLEKFEGPLDLLLHLVKEKQMTVTDIPLAEITDQFLAHVRSIQHELIVEGEELDAIGDFLVMAATLIQIKTRDLLPRDESELLDDDEMSKEDLIRLLQEYERFKAVASNLEEKMRARSKVFLRNRPYLEPEQEEVLKVDLTKLLEAFRSVLRRAPIEEVHELAREPIRIEDCMVRLRSLLRDRKSVLFTEIFGSVDSRAVLVATFLAILELIRSEELMAVQNDTLGEIRVMLREE